MNTIGTIIDLSAIRVSQTRKLAAGLIAPAVEDTSSILAPEHSAEPIKSLDDIYRVSSYLIEQGRYRDNMLFIVGINFGLRVSDLKMLRFSDIINPNFTFKDSFPVFEKKTRNTRLRKKNRYVTINSAVVEAVTIYLEHTPGVCMSDYMFRSESNRGKNQNNPLSTQAIDLILKGIARDLGLTNRMSSHTLRKTFCYWMMVRGHNDSRRLLLLQQMLNHSSPIQTLTYIGITGEEIEEAYRSLNLGGTQHYLVDSDIVELDTRVG